MAIAAIVKVWVRSAGVASVAALAFTAVSWGAALADETSPANPDAGSGTSWHEKTAVDVEPSGENWIGAEGYRRVAALYSGITYAPFTNLRQDGFRLRFVSGESIYKYAGARYDPVSDNAIWQRFTGFGRFIDAMAGWQWSHQNTTIKAFAGYEYQSNIIGPHDPELKIQGTARGAKGALEIWHNWTSNTWTSLDLSGAHANSSYSAQTRTGLRFEAFGDPGWSFGPEFAQTGNTQTTLRRAGLFIRFEELGYEFTISSGVATATNNLPSGYFTGQYLRRF